MAFSSINEEPFCPTTESLEDYQHFFIRLSEWCEKNNVKWKYYPLNRSHVFRKTEYEMEIALELCFGDSKYPIYEVSHFQMSAAESMEDIGLEGLCRSIETSLNRVKVTHPGYSTSQE
jgi:hypothetical protein